MYGTNGGVLSDRSKRYSKSPIVKGSAGLNNVEKILQRDTGKY